MKFDITQTHTFGYVHCFVKRECGGCEKCDVFLLYQSSAGTFCSYVSVNMLKDVSRKCICALKHAFYLYAYSPSHNSNIFSIKQKQDELVVSFHKVDEVMLHICDCVDIAQQKVDSIYLLFHEIGMMLRNIFR
jgi:hypothetical protein